jgi:serralysin
MDRLFGGEGNDVLEVDGIGDFVDGGAGIDTLVLNNSEYGVRVHLEHGILHSDGFKKGIPARGDRVTNVENVAGSEFADYITGDNGANLLNGLGGHGEDKLTGGDGFDTFQYSSLIDSYWIAGKPADQILDFQKGVDKIDLAALGFDYGDLTFKNNQTIDGENYTYFGYDANNNGTFDIAEFCVAVKMTPGVTLSASDFLF